jgi:hypothetical protein
LLQKKTKGLGVQEGIQYQFGKTKVCVFLFEKNI